MPGSSLWLLPPTNHPLNSILSSLIQKTATHFHSPNHFHPHVTLTSEISPSAYGSEPQKWLDSIPYPEGKDVRVKLGRLCSENVYVRKLYSKVEKPGVFEIGKISRKKVDGYEEEGVARKWAEEKYNPHLSLLYHDCPKVDGEVLAEIETLVREAGVNLEGEGELGGWVGGRVVLVPTDKPIKEWAPIAERDL